MNWDVKKMWPAVATSIVAVTTMLQAADKPSNMKCPPRGVEGPDREINPSARPFTADACCCDEGEFFAQAGAVYWKASEDGLNFAVRNQVSNGQYQGVLVEAEFVDPDFKWDWGFRVGIGYNSVHDGWDINLLWTHYHGKAHSDVEAEVSDNETLLPLWSNFAMPAPATTGGILFAEDIENHWRLRLDLVDLELGREFWTSRYLSLRPHIGLRAAWVRQNFHVQHKGGSWAAAFAGGTDLTNEVNGKNHYKSAVGVRGGLDSVWDFFNGWGLFGNVALSLLWGRFEVGIDEENRLAAFPFSKSDVTEIEDHFHSSRAVADLAFGIQYDTLFQDGRYGFCIALSWEHHMFFDQNQMWKIQRIGATTPATPQNNGQTAYFQSRGSLATQGWSLTATLTF